MLRKRPVLIITLLIVLVALLGANLSVLAQEADPARPDVSAVAAQLAAARQAPLAAQNLTANRIDPSRQGVILPDGRALVIVELAAEPAAVTYARSGGADGGALAESMRDSQQSIVAAEQAAFVSSLSAAGIVAEARSATDTLANTVTLAVESAEIAALRQRPGVLGVYPVRIMERDMLNTLPYLGVPAVWSGFMGGEYTGEGTVISIIDSGVDYTHVNFGGDGTWPTDPAERAALGDEANFPGTKVIGGYDYVGDFFNAGNNEATNLPIVEDATPDPDPIDCSIIVSDLQPTFGVVPNEQTVGHGTHVAGIASGLGVTTGGDTFMGDYATIDLDTLSIGPGVAPGAQLIAMKVFGCYGSTFYSHMIDAMDDSVSGRYSSGVQADVISMSIGSGFGFGGDDPFVDFFSRVVENAALAGTLSVFSAGNSGDLFYATGAPATAGGAISVASISVGEADAGIIVSGTTADGQYSAATSNSPVTATIGPSPLYFVNDGCQQSDWASFPANHVALVDWAEVNGAFPCGSTARQNAARASNTNNGSALPIAILMYATVPYEFISIACTSNGPNIPCLDIQNATGLLLLNNIATAQVTLDPALIVTAPDLASTISGFSSRGPRQGDENGGIKPDLAAPGDHSIYTAGAGTGSLAWGLGGTSMATPHVAGIASLLLSSGGYDRWTPYQLKALLMNTANNDAYLGNNVDGPRIGTSRMGSGIVDIYDAFNSDVIAYNREHPELVGVSFGTVETPNDQGPIEGSRFVRFQNRGATDITYNLSLDIINDHPYFDFVIDPEVITVPAYSSADVEVMWIANTEFGLTFPYGLTDPSVALAQATIFGGFARQFLSEETGNLIAMPAETLVAANGGDPAPLRVPLYASIRPASNMYALDNPYVFSDSSVVGNGFIRLDGDDVYPATPFFDAENPISLVSAFQLTGTDNVGDTVYPLSSLDLQHVGVSTGDSGFGQELRFGVSTVDDIDTLTSMSFEVYIDLNQDGFTGASDDWFIFTLPLPASQGGPTDMWVTVMGLASSGSGSIQEFVNGVTNDVNTYQFNTNVFNLVVYADELWFYDNGDKEFNFYVTTFSLDVGDYVDVSPVMTYNAETPYIDTFYGNVTGNTSVDTWFGGVVPFGYDLRGYNVTQESLAPSLLLLHHHNDGSVVNGAGQVFRRAEVVLLDVPVVDMSIDKTASVSEALPGDSFTYEISFANWDGGETGEGYFVDELPDSISLNGWSTNEPDAVSCGHTGEPYGGTLTCQFMDVAPQLEEVFYVWLDVTIDPTFVGEIVNTVEIVPDAIDNFLPDNDDSVTVTVSPNAPVGIAPTGSVFTSDPTFSWTHVDGGMWYELYVYENLAQGVSEAAQMPIYSQWFDGGLVCAEGVCSVTPDTNMFTGDYWWTVRAWHNTGGYSTWSAPLFFMIATQTGTPTPIAPMGATSATNPAFNFSDVPGADSYYLWVDKGSGPNAGHVADMWVNDADVCDGFTCWVDLGLDLDAGAYSWWVQAWSNSGGYSAWSSETQFTVTTPPSAPVLWSPTGSIMTMTPDFVWSHDDSATWHYVWIADENGTIWAQWYDNAWCEFGTCEIPAPMPMTTGFYTWWVQSWSPFGGYSAWSSGANFTVAVPPAPPTQVAPMGVIDSGSPSFIFNSVAGGDWYYIWVASDSGHIMDQWYSEAACAGDFCVVNPGLSLPDGQYRWWVQAWSSAGGYSAWSGPAVFNVNAALVAGGETPEAPAEPEAPAPEAPAEGG